MNTVYAASKLRHAEMWQRIASEWTGLNFVSCWFRRPDLQTESEAGPDVLRKAWEQNESDCMDASYVLVYAENNEELRGAVCEAGMGIANGAIIVLVGESPSYGTWKYHPSVVQLPDLNAALMYIAAHK